jgi:hypothetical protein
MSLVYCSGAQLNQEHLPTWGKTVSGEERTMTSAKSPKQERLKSGFVESGKDNGVL